MPQPLRQAEVIRAALRRADAAPESISYVEAHGTGTALGDPVELDGLGLAFGDLPPGSCAIGSVKSNIGHLEGAAGIAGLTKVVLQLRHRTLAPSLHGEPPNPAVPWDGLPFRLHTAAAPWPGPLRRAGLSSFGAGGSNAHVILEEYPS